MERQVSKTKFTLMVPVEIVATSRINDRRYLWKRLQESGSSMWSTGGYEYNVRTDRLKWRDFEAMYRAATETR